MEEEGVRERERESVRVSRHLSRGHTCRALLESRKGDSDKEPPHFLFLHLYACRGTLKRNKLGPPFRIKPLSFFLSRVAAPLPPFSFSSFLSTVVARASFR